jgi:hypothetical protein
MLQQIIADLLRTTRVEDGLKMLSPAKVPWA